MTDHERRDRLRALARRAVPGPRRASGSPTTGVACSACPATAARRRLRPSAGLAWAGGYIGRASPPSNAAGRALADLILGVDSDLVRLPWVGHRSRRWEPEPLRWLGVHAVASMARVADPVARLAVVAERDGTAASRRRY